MTRFCRQFRPFWVAMLAAALFQGAFVPSVRADGGDPALRRLDDRDMAGFEDKLRAMLATPSANVVIIDTQNSLELMPRAQAILGSRFAEPVWIVPFSYDMGKVYQPDLRCGILFTAAAGSHPYTVATISPQDSSVGDDVRSCTGLKDMGLVRRRGAEMPDVALLYAVEQNERPVIVPVVMSWDATDHRYGLDTLASGSLARHHDLKTLRDYEQALVSYREGME